MAQAKSKPQQSKASGRRGQTKKKVKRPSISSGRIYINASFNNTLVYITDPEGNVISWNTAGGQGFKGARKSTPFAAQKAAEAACESAKEYSLRSVDVYINGPGPGSEAAARAAGNYFKVLSLSNITGVPHNGCRAEKERRV